jgi:hypothetical protein
MQAEMITATQMGTIIIGGQSCDLKSLEKAIETQVNAIIIGSISSDLIPLIEAASLPVIVTEGFGDIPMNPATFELLSTYVGREANLDPTTEMRWKNRRPEIIVPLPASEQHKQQNRSLEIGTRIRALRAPYQGAIGTIASLPPYLCRTESGVKSRCAEVDFESAGKAFIPFENLEIVH